MTPQYKKALLDMLRSDSERMVNSYGSYPTFSLLKDMLPWLKEQHPDVDFATESNVSTVHWNKYLHYSGLKRPDFFLNIPVHHCVVYGDSEGEKREAHAYFIWSSAYPMPTIGSVCAKIRYCLTNGMLAELIEQYYTEAGEFQEAKQFVEHAKTTA